MTEATRTRIPQHLKRYIVDQNYARYSPEDQAVWRYIMRQLKNFLGEHAHSSYLNGLKKTGIEVDRIPRIENIDAHLEPFGWGAVPVSGFIPPAAFMEFQSIGVLPIASDMRTLEHLLYTPAPDIIHEAAGHAPILIQPEYAAYLRQYGEVARHSIASKEDMAQYEAIRVLSDLKENPGSTPAQIATAEQALIKANQQMRFVSETGLLSRMNWWTAEYGLIGDLSKPKIFGAGLLSSVGEASACLSSKVRKIPLSLECVDFAYDITEPQPQLFVTSDFAQLGEVLEQLAERLAYRRGGTYGLDRAIEAETITTAVLDSGVQISGQLKAYLKDANGQACYLQFQGPTQLSHGDRELAGQGCAHHSQGFSSPVGSVKGFSKNLHQMNSSEVSQLGLKVGSKAVLEFDSGVTVAGTIKKWAHVQDAAVILTWQDCRVTRGDELLFDPSWGEYDMAIGMTVTSVFGGPADRTRYGSAEEYINTQIPLRKYTELEKSRHEMFRSLRQLRESPSKDPGLVEQEFSRLLNSYLKSPNSTWLQGIELLELGHRLGLPAATLELITKNLQSAAAQSPTARECVDNGIRIAKQEL